MLLFLYSFDVTPGATIQNTVKFAHLPADLRRFLRLNGIEPLSSASTSASLSAHPLATCSLSLMHSIADHQQLQLDLRQQLQLPASPSNLVLHAVLPRRQARGSREPPSRSLSLHASASGSSAQPPQSKLVVRFVFDASFLPPAADPMGEPAPKLLFGWTRRSGQLATTWLDGSSRTPSAPACDASAMLDISRYRAVVEYRAAPGGRSGPQAAQSVEAELAALFLERLRSALSETALVEVLQLLASFGQNSGTSGARTAEGDSSSADSDAVTCGLVERFMQLLRATAHSGDADSAAMRNELLLAEFAAFLSSEQARACGLFKRHRFVQQLRSLAASIEASLLVEPEQHQSSPVVPASACGDAFQQAATKAALFQNDSCGVWTRDEDTALLECYLQRERQEREEIDDQLVTGLGAQLTWRSFAQIRSRLAFLIEQLKQLE